MLAAALAVGAIAGYAAHRSSAGPAVGTVEATWSCTDGALCQGLPSGALPALSFARGSCPRSTIAVGNAHDDLIRAVLPAGTYRVAFLLADAKLVEPVTHSTVTVRAGETTHLGVMTPNQRAVPYPLFCD